MIAERLFRSSATWAFASLASLTILCLQLGGEALREVLQYDRVGLETAGEWYRLLTGHWVHFNWQHAQMNVAGLWLLTVLDTDKTGLRASLLRSLILSLVVGLALHTGHPELRWYVGLSGVLHGLFVIMLVTSAWRQRSGLAMAVLFILIGKLAWEHYHGALTRAALDVPVIVAAHTYGALAGLAYAFVMLMTRPRPGSSSNHKP
jgi:rhomboid family GlyGly-CTERM serine protease